MKRLFDCRACWLVVVPLLLASLIGPAFWNPSNLKSVLAAIAIEGLMCVGMTIVMVAGGFDLSIGSVMAMAGVIVVSAEPWGLPVAIALALAAAGLVGLLNGLLVGVLRINPFIATLATMIIVRAGVLTATNAEPVSGADLTLMEASRAAVLGIPLTGVLLILLTAAGHYLLTRLRVGREIHALGGNEAAARSSGVATVRLKILCYTLCGLTAGLAGILLAGQLNTGSPIIGEQAALNVITAVLLGGTSLKGGVGTAWGSLAGLLSVGILENAMRTLDVPAYWQKILQGCLLLGIIVLDRLAVMKNARRFERATG